MGAPFKIYDFSVFNRPPENSVMAALAPFEAKGWFDDSRTADKYWSIGGYVGGSVHWEEFEESWPMALANHDVPYFHMREMADPDGVYAKWHPPQEHQTEIAAFFLDLTKVIGRSGLVGFNCLVRLEDLARFNTENGLDLEAYALATYGCMLLIGEDYYGRPTELVFDHVEKVQSKLALAEKYAESDRAHRGRFDKIVTTGLPKDITWRDVPALQAADFWTWEYRKNHSKLEGWWSLSDRPQNYSDKQWEHMSRWVTDKFGSFEDATRKSLQELLRRTNIKPMIWDYHQLCLAHLARGGVWA